MGTQDNRAGQADLQALTNCTPLASSSRTSLSRASGDRAHRYRSGAGRPYAEYRTESGASGLLAIDYQGMTGVMATLEPYSGRHLVCQKVDNLALAFITWCPAQLRFCPRFSLIRQPGGRRLEVYRNSASNGRCLTTHWPSRLTSCRSHPLRGLPCIFRQCPMTVSVAPAGNRLPGRVVAVAQTKPGRHRRCPGPPGRRISG